ncbi:hypothetical protein [Nocardioides nitrophenolicus]|uniref:hypothetical protein n=1 Tax=Nocardioides nitrophenolicus TaxID=60489 RepID=UPI001957A0A1|nr:hypothetical protein [Nocardioides nitrophenolicus]MBM7517818.1 hypothetical protein [Nocardioides nitrophenolicus]
MRKAVATIVAITAAALLPGVGTPVAAAAGAKTVTSWAGGSTRVCVTPNGNGTSTVSAWWDGRGYPNAAGDFRESGAGGLAHVADDFTLSGWTYSHAAKGTIGPTVSIQRPSNGWVYVLSGSRVGITVEAVVPVRTLPACSGAGRAVPATRDLSRDAGQDAGQDASQDASRRAATCVSKKEFRRIDKGMRPGKVRRTVGAKGTVVTTAEFSAVRRYDRCGGGSVVVNFKRAGAAKALKVDSRFKG